MFESVTSIFGSSGGLIAGLLALIIVLLICYFVYRLISRPSFGPGRRNKQARLAITDAINFGPKHKLVLLRRDDIEHLVLIGGPTDLVVESNIRRNAAVRPREQGSQGTLVSPPASQEQKSDTKPDKVQRLRPVANEKPKPQEQPKPSPPQGISPSQKTSGQSEFRPTEVANLQSVKSTVAPRETPVASPPRAAPMPPVSSPAVPAALGGLVAAPVAAVANKNPGEAEVQESPFRDQPINREEAIESKTETVFETTTAPPREKLKTDPDTSGESGGSIAEDMDALIDELSAKR